MAVAVAPVLGGVDGVEGGEGDAEADVLHVELQEERAHVLRAQLARDLRQRNLLQNLLSRSQDLIENN